MEYTSIIERIKNRTDEGFLIYPYEVDIFKCKAKDYDKLVSLTKDIAHNLCEELHIYAKCNRDKLYLDLLSDYTTVWMANNKIMSI